MSDREELRRIFSSEESDSGPLDGERAEVDAPTVAEADEDETNDLSPEELVAESIRQTNAELGIEDEEEADAESVDASTADEADDIAALKEKARRWEEYEAQQAEQAVRSRYEALQAQDQQNAQQRDAEKQKWTNWYMGRQLTSLLARMDADAQNAPDPEAYKRAHRQNIIDACIREERLQHETLDEKYKEQLNALHVQKSHLEAEIETNQQKPAYADFLMTHEELNLPNGDLQIRHQILLAGEGLVGKAALDAMTRRAREIAWSVEFLRRGNQAVKQQAAEVKAKEVKFSQPHPATATNSPRRAKPVDYDRSPAERKKLLAAIL